MFSKILVLIFWDELLRAHDLPTEDVSFESLEYHKSVSNHVLPNPDDKNINIWKSRKYKKSPTNWNPKYPDKTYFIF